MNKTGCVIFDCDGVLVDSEVLGIKILLAMTAEYGVRVELEQAVKDLSGRRLKEAIQMLQTQAQADFPADLEQQFRAKSYEIFEREVLPVEGIREVLEALPVPYCVASSGPVEKICLNLTITGLIPYFEQRIFSAYEINSWKPDPGIFLHAARQMGFTPDECVVIEDSLAGIQAAKAGGFKVFGYANGHNARDLEEAGATVFHHMRELPALLAL
jgi:HAD superfamily hydrolase (TIGR01509 family)